jgi:putative ABC transport system permease protein
VHFKVIGTFRPTADGDAESETQTIYVPFTTFQHAFNQGNTVGWLAVTSAPGIPASVAEGKVRDLLEERHRVAPDDDRAFGSFNLEERFQQIQGLFRGIRLLVWIVGAGTLAAGAIGVSNIMLMIVRERTREIGIRRALGATPLTVTGQILLESLLLTSIAGYVGLVAGVALTEAVASWTAGMESSMFADPEVRLAGALQALGILAVAGILAGLIPARRAVRVRPVQALRAG